LQGAIPALVGIEAQIIPGEDDQVLVGVRVQVRTGLTSPAAVVFGSNPVRVSFPPPATVLASLVRISLIPPAIVLAKLLRIRGAVLRALRAHARLAVAPETVTFGAIAGPLRRRSRDPAPRAALLRRDHDLIRVSGCVLRLVLALARPITLPAIVMQPVLRTPVLAELGHRKL